MTWRRCQALGTASGKKRPRPSRFGKRVTRRAGAINENQRKSEQGEESEPSGCPKPLLSHGRRPNRSASRPRRKEAAIARDRRPVSLALPLHKRRGAPNRFIEQTGSRGLRPTHAEVKASPGQ